MASARATTAIHPIFCFCEQGPAKEEVQALGAEQLVPGSGQQGRHSMEACEVLSYGWLLAAVQASHPPHPEQTPESPLLDFRVLSLGFPQCSQSGS